LPRKEFASGVRCHGSKLLPSRRSQGLKRYEACESNQEIARYFNVSYWTAVLALVRNFPWNIQYTPSVPSIWTNRDPGEGQYCVRPSRVACVRSIGSFETVSQMRHKTSFIAQSRKK
jgi:hypothetical protein